MTGQVELSIVLPLKTYLTEKVGSVLLPVIHGDVNILPDRAPNVLTFDYGLLQIFDAQGAPKKKFFVKSGMADVALNKCVVMTSTVVPYEDMTPHLAKQKLEEVDNEDDRLFYQMILDYQRGVRRRYLKKLNIFGRKTGKLKFKDSSGAKSEK